MLMTKEVVVTWGGRNKNWYISKGYTFTKLGDQFIAKVQDLTKGNNSFVEVMCDGENCNENTLTPKWRDYLKSVKTDGKYYCVHCSHKLDSFRKNLSKSALKKGKSFEEFCLENNKYDLLERWDYQLNSLTPSEITHGTKQKYYFKCPRGLHTSELKTICNFMQNSENIGRCEQCNSFAQYGIDNICEDFLEKYWDYDKNTDINPFEISYGSTDQFVWIKCQNKDYHGSYYLACGTFTNPQFQRCPYCSNQKIHKLDSLGAMHPETLDIWSVKNIDSPYEYSPKSSSVVWWKCPNGKHTDYKRDISNSNNKKFRCPSCSRERKESILQEKVRLYLNSLKYELLHENYCTLVPVNPKTKQNLPFDNEVVDLKLIIEVHGAQHYNDSSGKWFDEVHSFHKRQLYDRYKRMYAKIKGYYYLELSYKTDDSKETYKKLIDDKIKNILSINSEEIKL